MNNLETIYSMFNSALDHYDKAIHEVNKFAAEKIRMIVLDKKNYSTEMSENDIDLIDAIFTNMVRAMETNEKTLYKDHCTITGMVMDALFLKGDFELLDVLRSSEPFSLLCDNARNEIKAILELISMSDICQSDFVGSKLFTFATDNNLPCRKMICSLDRQFEGLLTT